MDFTLAYRLYSTKWRPNHNYQHLTDLMPLGMHLCPADIDQTIIFYATQSYHLSNV